MAVKVARMQNGEDVIADIQDIRESPQATQTMGYVFEDAFTIQIMSAAASQFGEEIQQDTLEGMQDCDLQFLPWSPLTVSKQIITPLSVVSIGDPHSNVLDRYKEVLAKWKTVNTVNKDVEVDYTQAPPTNVSVREVD